MQPSSNPPAMRWLRLDDWFLLFCEPVLDPHEDDWNHMLAQLSDSSLRGFISVINHDGHPSVQAHHLHAAAGAVRGQDYNIAVLTSHRVTLALARILEWLGVPLRCFASSELAQALDWIEVPPEQHQRFVELIESLRRGDSDLEVEVTCVRST